jgi:hypothetical protein
MNTIRDCGYMGGKMIGHAQIVEYFRNTTPAEVASIVVEAYDFDECLVTSRFITERARKRVDDEIEERR